ncbi:hypothetical protein E4Z66_09100 [Aliishimia ponticola]|uniref:Uncharacterized protein n=1 Tax=Aliishimia ponticola TaxID=2499833 RepID=A0A4S4NCD4_9RHOB|nr:hypothetical protein [Aliishimia ponticola]THH37082.1 hypothetical protein E4Z66_09100 [Aliishimia ponticola]
MTESQDTQSRLDDVRAQLRAVHRVRGRSLEQAVRRSRRLLPREVRRDAQVLVRAEQALGHPLLQMQTDMDAVRRAQDNVQRHLDSIDLADRRRGRLLGLAGVLAFNFLVVGALFLGWLIWSGQV